jgi:hypothetical protein
MKTQHATPAAKAKTKTTFTQALEQEAVELGSLHTGLVRHLDAWRGAHNAATLRVAAVTARIDAAIDRIEAKLTQR